MNKIAIISDIHANLSALEAVLEDIKNKNVDEIYCLGDLVIKSAHPYEVIKLVKANCKVVLKGNLDEFAATNKEYKYTRSKIGKEGINYLNDLPITYECYISGHLVRFFHSSPFSLYHIYNPMFSNKQTKYKDVEITNPEDMFKNTDFLGKNKTSPTPDIIVYGHIHTPNLFRYKNKMIVNAGSVGNPTETANKDIHDKTNKFSTLASYVIIEGNLNSKKLENINISFQRVNYDIQKEIKDLKATKLHNNDVLTLQTAISIE